MFKDVHYSFKNKKQPKNPTIGERVIKSWSTHWMVYCTTINSSNVKKDYDVILY